MVHLLVVNGLFSLGKIDKRGSSSRMRSLWCFLSLLLLQVGVVESEKVSLDLILDADSEEVHYVRGYLQAPATIDLASVRLITTLEPEFVEYDDDFFMDDDDSELIDDYNNKDDDYDPNEPLNDDVGTMVPTKAPTKAHHGKTELPTTVGDDNADGDGDDTDDTDADADADEPLNDDVGTMAPTKAPTKAHHKKTEPPTTVGDDNADGDGDDMDNADADADADDMADTDADADGDGTMAGDDVPGDDIPGDDIPGDDIPGDDIPTNAPVPTQTPTSHGTIRRLDGKTKVTQVIDFVLFMVPEDCKKDIWGHCDWSALGIGAGDDEVEGDISYCCSPDTADRKLCKEEDIGKLIVDPVLFSGQRKIIRVPDEINKEFHVGKEGATAFDIKETGDYVLLMGNCVDDGFEILEQGSMEWKSSTGYVPGDIYGLMLFYGAMTVVYLLLVLWYSCGMKMYQDAAIPIQRWIIATMILGFLELFFKSIDLGYWNLDGFRSVPVAYFSIFLGVFKRGLSRCLGVMVAQGWGIVRESLGGGLCKIVILGTIYVGLSGFRDLFLIIAQKEVEKVSATVETELYDFSFILWLLIVAVNGIFFIWIINSLNGTIAYLRNMNQTDKLKRHLKLRCVMVTSLLISFAWLAFFVLNAMMGVLRKDQIWIMEGIMHINYLYILTGVGILWRPNANAKDYAMQMQIPSNGGGFESDDENDLELSCVVPSAGEYDNTRDFD